MVRLSRQTTKLNGAKPMAEDLEIKTEKSNLQKGKPAILIVDDEPSICRVLQEFLHSKGFQTQAAPFAAPALVILDTTRVDLVITNIRMPGMDGLEFTRLIKARYDSDVIIMTGYHSYTYEEAIRIGAGDLLHKPFKLADLLSSITKTSHRNASNIQ
jgi:DNA-binding NtrC family response regulator